MQRTTGAAERQAAHGAARLASLSERGLGDLASSPDDLVPLWAAVRALLAPRRRGQVDHPVGLPPWYGTPGWGRYDHWDDGSLDAIAAAAHQVTQVLLQAAAGSVAVDGEPGTTDEGQLVVRDPAGEERNPLLVVRLALARQYDGSGRDSDLLACTRDALAGPDPEAACTPERLRLHLRGHAAGLLRRRRALDGARVGHGLARLGAVPDGDEPGVHRLFPHDREWRAVFRLRDGVLEVVLGGTPEGDRRGSEALGVRRLLLGLCALAVDLSGEVLVVRPERTGVVALTPDDVPRLLRALGPAA